MSDELIGRLEHYGRTTAMPGSLNDDLDALVERLEAAERLCDQVLTDSLAPAAPLAQHIRSILRGEVTS